LPVRQPERVHVHDRRCGPRRGPGPHRGDHRAEHLPLRRALHLLGSASAVLPAPGAPRVRGRFVFGLYNRRMLALLLALAAAPAPPNLLLVTIDTLRADRVGAYGYAGAATPTLDRLARDGVLVEEA